MKISRRSFTQSLVLGIPAAGMYSACVAAEAPSSQPADGFVPLFNGVDLTGWQGDTKLWLVERGELVGRSPGIGRNEFLATTNTYGDFILKFTFKLVNTSGQANSGMQFRSKRVAGSTEVSGYQADVGQQYWGSLYDESRRGRTLVSPSKEIVEKAVRHDQWNEYVITAKGAHIRLELNGIETVDYTEPEPPEKISRTGILALQIHAGGPMEIRVREVVVKELSSDAK